jgi:AraC-like DNA-binding protein
VKRLGALSFWTRDSNCSHFSQAPEDHVSGGSDQVKLVLHLSGEAQLEGGGRVERLRPQTWGLYGFAKTCRITGPFKQLIVSVPMDPLASSDLHLARMMKRQFSTEAPAVALAYRFFASLRDWQDEDTHYGQELGDVGIRLLRLAIAEQYARLEGHSRQEKFRTRIMNYVDLHLHDPSLTVEAIARAHQCSSRYLQKMFGNAESLSRYIWRMRLERCSAALADPTNCHRSITEIAFSTGFSNTSHFSRAFRQRFASSPRQFRNKAMHRPASKENFAL